MHPTNSSVWGIRFYHVISVMLVHSDSVTAIDNMCFQALFSPHKQVEVYYTE